MENAKYSASFRVFAFLALSSAIAAVAWTIRDPLLLAVGILGLAAGHYYSWRRHDASIRRRLILLLFMGLTVFLGGDILRSGLGDRLLLSRYLIYGLVIGSFDLMQRRNVIASLILGGLLLVLVSELALNFWFLVFPAAFTLLALMAVVFSRVEAPSGEVVLVGGFSWLDATRLWLGFAACVLLLSAVLFLFMPRLVTNQMAQASWLPSRLDLSLGGLAMLPSRPGASVAPGILPSLEERGAGEGEYATLGYVGSAADVPVMRVRSRVSSYWRGLVLDRYDGRGWLQTSPQLILRDANLREFVFPDSKIRTSKEKVYWQAFYLLSDQPNAVFTGYWPGRVYLPRTVATFSEKGTLYRALSLVPHIQPDILRRDRVVSDDVAHLALPPITERTAALAEAIVAGAPTDYDKAARLERFLLNNYPYDLNVGALPPGRDAVDYFLFEQQAGYCAQFATAMAVMARHVGLPARVAAGYLPGYIDPMTGAHVVRAGDAHAWVEIHFQWHGWVAFDPTPRPDAALGFAAGGKWLHFGLEDFTGVSLAGLFSPLAMSFSLGPLAIPGWLWLVLAGAGVAIGGLVLLLRRRRAKAKPKAGGYTALEGEARRAMIRLYRRMLTILERKGLPPRQPHQPPYQYAALIQRRISEGGEIVAWLSQAAASAAYDPAPFDPATVVEARQKLALLKRAFSELK